MTDSKILSFMSAEEIGFLLDASAYTGDASERAAIVASQAMALRPRLKNAK